MQAMILAAGRGERMRPLTDHTPKPLLKVGGKSLIVWHLERLAAAGFEEIVINHAHLGEQIEQALGNGQQWGVSIQYSPEKMALETAGGIANALHLLGTEAFLVVNGDVYTDVDFSQYHARAVTMVKENRLAHLVLVDNPKQHAAGDFALHEHLVNNDGIEKLTFSGVGIYQPNLFANIVKGQPAKLAPILREAMLKQQVSGEHFKGEWHDIGTPERLQALDAQLSKSINV
ncbi:MAG TPA: nucleotidyltransferase family protein [Methylotenera sp.]|nr:nucleotidyltransferase family protein [Methylotenera sp.]